MWRTFFYTLKKKKKSVQHLKSCQSFRFWIESRSSAADHIKRVSVRFPHLLSSCPSPGTSGSDSTDSGSAGACRWGTPCCLDTCRWDLCGRSSWRSLCSLRSCTRRSASLRDTNPHQWRSEPTPPRRGRWGSFFDLSLIAGWVFVRCFQEFEKCPAPPPPPPPLPPMLPEERSPQMAQMCFDIPPGLVHW